MNYPISEIIDLDNLQSLMQKFTAVTGATTSLLDLDGHVLVSSGLQDICQKFHRVHPETGERCAKSDISLANELKKGQQYNMYRCLNGLVDVAVPVNINNQHMANLFLGQFLTEEPDLEFFRKQAKTFGFDEKKYLDALSEVSVLSTDEVKNRVEYLSQLASFIGDSGMTKLKLQETLEEQDHNIKEQTRELKDAQIATLNIMQDVDEARQAAEKTNDELKKMMTQLERSNTDLEQFAYVASHDLQEPLRMVISFTQLLQRRYQEKLDATANEYIDFAVDGAARMQVLINDLLSFSRVGTQGAPFEKLDCNKIIELVLKNLQMSIDEKKAEVLHDHMPVIMGDDNQLIQLFQNLISNAIKFSSKSKPKVQITAKENGDHWLFSIKDNGIGIAPEYHERVFVIFQRLHTKEKYSGTGIGLAICKRIVERHNGRIWVESQPGEGTTFHFTIPNIGEPQHEK